MIGSTDVDAITPLPVNNSSKDSHLFNLSHRMRKLIKHLWKEQHRFLVDVLASLETQPQLSTFLSPL